jgi:hypothetical protein
LSTDCSVFAKKRRLTLSSNGTSGPLIRRSGIREPSSASRRHKLAMSQPPVPKYKTACRSSRPRDGLRRSIGRAARHTHGPPHPNPGLLRVDLATIAHRERSGISLDRTPDRCFHQLVRHPLDKDDLPSYRYHRRWQAASSTHRSTRPRRTCGPALVITDVLIWKILRRDGGMDIPTTCNKCCV